MLLNQRDHFARPDGSCGWHPTTSAGRLASVWFSLLTLV